MSQLDSKTPFARRRDVRAGHPSFLPTAHRPRPTSRSAANRPAFTLIELLVVIGIIVAVVALGIPLFGVLTGSRSQEAGQNLVAAMIGQARTTAVNEGKYAGVLFYVDPATERTAMSLVVAQDPSSGLEDPDPYEKYKLWSYRTPAGGVAPRYRAPAVVNNTPTRGDRVVGLATDASATFRAGASQNVYNPATTANRYFSRLSLFFGNYKPIVRAYRARQDTSPTSDGTARPPRSGPFFANSTPGGTGNSSPSLQFRRVEPAANLGTPSGVSAESVDQPYANADWGPDTVRVLSPIAASEQQLLPVGVGVQVMAQATYRSDTAPTPAATPVVAERYFRTALIMFDPQGRVTLEPFSMGRAGTLAEYLGLAADAPALVSGIGVVMYDATAFRAAGYTDADWYYQNTAANLTARIQSSRAPLLDNQGQSVTVAVATTGTGETAEEQWLDANTVPLLLNRFSGALSAGQ